MSLRLTVRSAAAAVAATSALTLATGTASAVKLVLRGPGVLPAGTAVTARSFGITAGAETCALTELQGVIISNSKPTDTIKLLSGTLTGCLAGTEVITSTYSGLPYTLKLSHLGTFKEKGTPRVRWIDTFAAPPGVCKYETVSAVPAGSFTVPTHPTPPAPVILEVSNWLITPFSSSPSCGPGSLTANFELLVPSVGPVESEDS
jgi:hypothetical protein